MNENFRSSSAAEIRDEILRMKRKVIAAHVHDESCEEIREVARKPINEGGKGDPDWKNACMQRDLTIMIKPGNNSTYQGMIQLLDEMTINQVRAYALMDITPVEEQLLQMSASNR